MVVNLDVLDVLCIQQRSIAKLAMGLTAGSLASLAQAPDLVDGWLSHLTDLTIPNGYGEESDRLHLRVWKDIIQAQRNKLRRLELAPTELVRPPVTAVVAWETIRRLFGQYVSPTSTEPALMLDSLVLRGLNFGDPIATLIRAINFPNLKHLEVTHMKNNGTFFRDLQTVLNANPGTIKLKRLHLSTIDDTAAIALGNFLSACPPLRDLTIKAKGPITWMLPNTASFTKHSATLRVFAFSVYEGSETDGWIVHIVHPTLRGPVLRTMTHLEELSLHLGRPIAAGDRGTPYSRASARMFATRICRISLCCPSLRALRLLRWPIYPLSTARYLGPPDADDDFPERSWELLRHGLWYETQRMAENVFRAHSQAARSANAKELRVLMFGTTDWDCHIDFLSHSRNLEGIRSLTYLGREQIDFDGVRTITAVKADVMDVKYDDRDYVMFDYGN